MQNQSKHLGAAGYRALEDGRVRLFCEDVDLAELARSCRTPFYFYSENTIRSSYQRFEDALCGVKHKICFAAKANSSIAVLKLLASMGSAFDTVSAGEILRAVYAGADPKNIVFSGVGKTEAEIRIALELGISSIHAESIQEVERISRIAGELGVVAPVAVRINPDIDPHTLDRISTGRKTTKFGVTLERVMELYSMIIADPNLRAEGIAAHIGSLISEGVHYEKLADVFISLVKRIEEMGADISVVDFGGGYGVPYKEGDPELDPAPLFARIKEKFIEAGFEDKTLMIEPGRSIVAAAGGLLTEVQYIKMKAGEPNSAFVVCDASMAELMRPTLYDSYHDCLEVEKKNVPALRSSVVGSICETSDWLAKDRLLRVERGDLLALMTAGAYGASMANNYNTHMLPAEVMINGGEAMIVKRRQRLVNLLADEVEGALDEEAMKRFEALADMI